MRLVAVSTSTIDQHVKLINGGPLTSGSLSYTIYARHDGSQYQDAVQFGLSNIADPIFGTNMTTSMSFSGGNLKLENDLTAQHYAGIDEQDWIQFRITYDRDQNTVTTEYREVNDTTGLDGGAYITATELSVDRDDHGFSPLNISHVYWGTTFGPGNVVAFINMEVPEPAAPGMGPPLFCARQPQ